MSSFLFHILVTSCILWCLLWNKEHLHTWKIWGGFFFRIRSSCWCLCCCCCCFFSFLCCQHGRFTVIMTFCSVSAVIYLVIFLNQWLWQKGFAEMIRGWGKNMNQWPLFWGAEALSQCTRLIEDKMIAHSCTAELLTWLLLISLTFLNLRLIHTVTSLALNLYIVRVLGGPRWEPSWAPRWVPPPAVKQIGWGCRLVHLA